MEPKNKETIKLSFCQNSDFLISISLQPNVVVVAGCKEIRKSMFVAKNFICSIGIHNHKNRL